MSYSTIYYSRKQRCIDCSPGEENCNIVPTPKLYTKSRSTSLFSSIIGSKNVYSSETSHIGLETQKGQGNTKKLGSGGNSYDAYLAKKRGIVNCNCSVSK